MMKAELPPTDKEIREARSPWRSNRVRATAIVGAGVVAAALFGTKVAYDAYRTPPVSVETLHGDENAAMGPREVMQSLGARAIDKTAEPTVAVSNAPTAAAVPSSTAKSIPTLTKKPLRQSKPRVTEVPAPPKAPELPAQVVFDDLGGGDPRIAARTEARVANDTFAAFYSDGATFQAVCQKTGEFRSPVSGETGVSSAIWYEFIAENGAHRFVSDVYADTTRPVPTCP
jgi:hypothetical protein